MELLSKKIVRWHKGGKLATLKCKVRVLFFYILTVEYVYMFEAVEL